MEREVKATCVALLRRLGFKCYSFSDRRRSVLTPGTPDVFFRHAGKQIHGWIEVKRPGAMQRPQQIEFERDAKACGETYLLVDSVEVLWDYLKAKGFWVET